MVNNYFINQSILEGGAFLEMLLNISKKLPWQQTKNSWICNKPTFNFHKKFLSPTYLFSMESFFKLICFANTTYPHEIIIRPNSKFLDFLLFKIFFFWEIYFKKSQSWNYFFEAKNLGIWRLAWLWFQFLHIYRIH